MPQDAVPNLQADADQLWDCAPEDRYQLGMRHFNVADLAKLGVVAHTVSSFGLHKEYHRPNDDLAHLDLDHMTDAIGSMIEPVKWLVNSEFKPEWNAGQKP